jgi:hypothetical protein
MKMELNLTNLKEAAALDEIVQVLAECKCPLYRGYLTAE